MAKAKKRKQHIMTPARKAALRRAQKASAMKRKRNSVIKHTLVHATGGRKGISKRRKVIGYSMIAAGYGMTAYGAYRAHKGR